MSTINDRIKAVRKELKLSQEDFGESLGVSRAVIANLDNNRSEPSDPFIKLLCKQYNVDYIWLTTGNGEMFFQSDDPVADKINDLLESEDPTVRSIFTAFSKFSEDDWQLVKKFIDLLKNGAD